jgi:isopenicillin-N epimerase
VQRIWQRACAKAGAVAKTVELPLPFRTVAETVDAIFAAVCDQTRLIVVSHITSPTAVILPVAEICRQARERGIAVCIDGPHAIAQLPLAIDALGCDFYTASCHKWLSAPFGSGFLRVAPQWQKFVRPPVLSWGRIPPTKIDTWSDEFVWSGTRDPSAYLSIPAAIEFLEGVGLDAFRERTHWLAQYARRKLVELMTDLGTHHAPRDAVVLRSETTTMEPLVPDDPAWYGSMAHVPLPAPKDRTPATLRSDETSPVSNPLQHTIWRQLGIEVPIVDFRSRRYIRVSCHLYNDTEQIDRLVAGLGELLRQGA